MRNNSASGCITIAKNEYLSNTYSFWLLKTSITSLFKIIPIKFNYIHRFLARRCANASLYFCY